MLTAPYSGKTWLIVWRLLILNTTTKTNLTGHSFSNGLFTSEMSISHLKTCKTHNGPSHCGNKPWTHETHAKSNINWKYQMPKAKNTYKINCWRVKRVVSVRANCLSRFNISRLSCSLVAAVAFSDYFLWHKCVLSAAGVLQLWSCSHECF